MRTPDHVHIPSDRELHELSTTFYNVATNRQEEWRRQNQRTFFTPPFHSPFTSVLFPRLFIGISPESECDPTVISIDMSRVGKTLFSMEVPSSTKDGPFVLQYGPYRGPSPIRRLETAIAAATTKTSYGEQLDMDKLLGVGRLCLMENEVLPDIVADRDPARIEVAGILERALDKFS